MSTLEKVAWISITLVLIVAVSQVVIQPIYDMAKKQKGEIESIKFDDPGDTTYILDIDRIYAAMDKYDELNAA